MAKLLPPFQLIKNERNIGNGTEENPYRAYEQYYTVDGILVFEYDKHKDEVSMTANLLEFLRSLDK